MEIFLKTKCVFIPLYSLKLIKEISSFAEISTFIIVVYFIIINKFHIIDWIVKNK